MWKHVKKLEQRPRVYNAVRYNAIFITQSVITRFFPVDPDDRVIMELQCIYYDKPLNVNYCTSQSMQMSVRQAVISNNFRQWPTQFWFCLSQCPMKNSSENYHKHSIKSPQNTLFKSQSYRCDCERCPQSDTINTFPHPLNSPRTTQLVARQWQVSLWLRSVRCEESASFSMIMNIQHL